MASCLQFLQNYRHNCAIPECLEALQIFWFTRVHSKFVTQSIAATERKRQREMNGKLREELAIKCSNFNEEFPTDMRKVQETATNNDYYPPPLIGFMVPLTGLGDHTQTHHKR